ncbi:MAG: hypothetical protein RL564_1675, partial [Pseudomonadota bacterium]
MASKVLEMNFLQSSINHGLAALP